MYISQLIRFARVCSNVDDFNNRNLFLTAKLLKQGYRYHKIRKAFSKFYHRHSDLIVKYNTCKNITYTVGSHMSLLTSIFVSGPLSASICYV